MGSSPTVCFFFIFLEMAHDLADSVLDLLNQIKNVSMQYSALEESNQKLMRVAVLIIVET